VDLLVGALAVVAAVLLAWIALIAVLWLHRGTRQQTKVYARLVPDITRMVVKLLRDPTTPMRYRVGLVALAAWLLNPIDLIPDFLPVVGVLDDVVVTGLLLRWLVRGVGPDGVASHWSGTDDGLEIVRRAAGVRRQQG
jgi:uncharacterized membrane protein YkvA (DUF1232 family)